MQMKKDKESSHPVAILSDEWLKAAVIGSLWASVEIILGSFLHNIKMPMSGTVMSFISVMLIIAFSQVWKERWIILRAGIICALMKSVSPSAIILGPMVGITMEALLIELAMLALGRNLLAYMLGGGLAVSGVLIQKVVSLLIAYGLNFAYTFSNLIEYSSRQLSIQGISPKTALFILIGVYQLSGAWAALTGYILGKRALKETPSESPAYLRATDRRHPLFEQNKPVKYQVGLLAFHFVVLLLSLLAINTAPAPALLLPVGYIVFTLIRYRSIIRRLLRPMFWIQLLLITLLASVFLTGIRNGVLFSREGIIAGLLMDLRAILIFTSFSAISIELRNPFIRKILYGKGFGKLYASAGLAFAVLPDLLSSLPKGKVLIRKPGRVITEMVSSGSALYGRFRDESEQSAPVYIISGEVMRGKTSFTLDLVSRLQKDGLDVQGFYAAGLDSGRERKGFDLVNVATGEKTLLSRKEPAPNNWIRFGRYCFNPEAFEQGNVQLEQMVEKNPDLVLLDEIGPLELQNLGWAPAIDLLLSLNNTAQLWVIRKTMLEKVIKKWNLRNVTVFEIDSDDPGAAAQTIRNFLDIKK